MNIQKLVPFAVAALLAAASATAAAADACPLPGALIFDDPAGDEGVKPADALPVAAPVDPVGVVPVPEDNADLLTLHVAEVADTIVFTIKVATLESPIASGGYIVRFLTDDLPANGDEDYFVAMINTPDGTTFNYGTTGPQQDAGTGPRLFNIAGDLEASSNFTADGTITLVMKRDTFPGLTDGLDLYNMLFSVRALLPTGSAAQMTSNASNATLLDQNDGESGVYTLGGCGKSASVKSSSQLLAAGGLGLGLLAPLALMGLRRRRG